MLLLFLESFQPENVFMFLFFMKHSYLLNADTSADVIVL